MPYSFGGVGATAMMSFISTGPAVVVYIPTSVGARLTTTKLLDGLNQFDNLA